MSYTKTTWKDYPNATTPVNAENLNHMERGIADAHIGISDIKTELGNTDISTIGNGTVTGAISLINSDLSESGKHVSLGGANSNGILQLSDSINNYRNLQISIVKSATHVIVSSTQIPVSLFKTFNSSNYRLIVGTTLDMLYEGDAYYVDDTHVSISCLTNASIFFEGVK